MTAKLNFWSALFLLLPALVLTFGCKDENLDIQDSKDRLDVLEGTTIKSINEQIFAINTSISDLEETDKALDAYIKELEAGLSATNDTLTKLKHADEALDKKITDLQTYVDAELTKITDWADATFVTIEQYSVVQTEISAIKTLIDKTKSDITKEYTTAIETAISNSETGMKEWVNSELTKSYYTISDVDGKVSALEALISDGDTNLQNQINEQKAALQQAKADLTNEYKQYINQAIASGGIIDQAIATQVRKAQDELQSKIDAINERLDALEDRLGKLEEDFVNRIQSLKYIPEYSDRKVKMSDFDKSISLDFLVSPSSQAKAVQQAWETNDGVVSAYMRCTKNPETKAISPATQLLVTSVVGNDDGTLNVTMKEDKANPIDTEFFEGDSDAVVYIKISDGNSDIFSDVVSVIPQYRDLSPLINGVYQTANCYIINRAGGYKFKAFKGNSQELAGVSDSDIHPKGEIGWAEVLWESFGTDIEVGDLIKSADYKDGYILFETSMSYEEGNAVIAAKDASGNILWSWHIWLTDQPQAHVYNNNAGTMMDRNLGATSATPGDAGALGLLYQWGRKDPFLGSSSISDNIKAKSTITWPSPVETSSSVGTVNYTTSYPTTVVKGISSSDYDWHFYSRDNTLWATSDKDKSIYDPCPAGWRVPNGGGNGVWSIAGFVDTNYNRQNRGMLFSIYSPSTTWYPAAGRLDASYSDHRLNGVGDGGYYWSVSPKIDGAYRLWFTQNSQYYPSENGSRADGCSIRCQKE